MNSFNIVLRLIATSFSAKAIFLTNIVVSANKYLFHNKDYLNYTGSHTGLISRASNTVKNYATVIYL